MKTKTSPTKSTNTLIALFLLFIVLISNDIMANTPDGISDSQWQNIKQQINSDSYNALKQGDGDYLSSNINNGWNIQYGKDGETSLTPNHKDKNYFIGLKLKSLGYTNQEQFNQPQSLNADNGKLTYQWNDNVKEIWTNSHDSLEQWFEIEKRPVGDKQNLVLQLALNSDLAVTQKGNALNFSNKITYDKLKVWDSKGTQIVARMDYNDNLLSLIVEDQKAVYPLTIDPVFKHLDYVKASNTDIDDRFGFSVSLDGNTMVVGAPHEDSLWAGNESDNNLSNSGAAYVFVRNAFGFWNQEDYLKASILDENARFGYSVAISGDTIVVGAVDSDNAFVYTRSSGVWTEQAVITASNGESGDYFGESVAIYGDSIVVGASRESSNATGIDGDGSNNSEYLSGAAYVFTRSGSSWSQDAYLKASNTDADDKFGSSVAISNDTIVIGARNEDSNATGIDGDGSNNSLSDSGAVYVFNLAWWGSWEQQAYIKNSTNTTTQITFGKAVAIDGETVVASMENDVAIYTRSSDIWSKQASIDLNGGNQIGYGKSVAISGDILVIGDEEDSSSGFHTGSAHVYFRNGQAWELKNTITANDGDELDDFGGAVAISGEYIVVGAPRESSDSTGINNDDSNNDAARSGAISIYRESYKVNVNVTGISAPASFTLVNNSDSLYIINGSGIYTFTATLFTSSPYNITVETQPDSLFCSVQSGTGSINLADITIAVICSATSGNTAPVVVNDSYTIVENGFLDANDSDGTVGGTDDDGVLVNDSDAESDTLSVVTPGSYIASGIGGDIVMYVDGTFIYSPLFDTSGVATFTYNVTDGNLTTSATLTITVGTSNDLIFKSGFE